MALIRVGMVSAFTLAAFAASIVPVATAATQPSPVQQVLDAAFRGGRGGPPFDRQDRGRGNGRNNARDDGRVLFTWAGSVDREARITMRGRDISIRNDIDRGRDRNSRPRANGALPRTDGRVTLRVTQGRGDVDVVQQPSARNNYTLVVRVRDARGGDDRYRVTAYWSPDDRGGWGRDGDWGRDRDRDGDWGRDRDDDDWGRDRNDDRRRNDDWGRNGRGISGMRWTGLVDDVVDLRIQGRNVEVIERSGARTRDVRSEVGQALPRQSAQVRVLRADGRGDVTVIQQPAVWNGFTAVVRIRDPRGGADRYDIEVGW